MVPFFLIQVGCPVYLAKDPACLKQERSSPRRLDSGISVLKLVPGVPSKKNAVRKSVWIMLKTKTLMRTGVGDP